MSVNYIFSKGLGSRRYKGLSKYNVYGKPGTMAASGTGQTTAAGSPYSKKDLKGNCTADNAPEQQHQELGD